MTSLVRRAVLVYRTSTFEALVTSSGSLGQANYYVASRSRRMDAVSGGAMLQDVAAMNESFDHLSQEQKQVMGAIPSDWRQTTVERAQLSRFLFEPDDIVIVFGQDGLVANVAKYLDGQPVIGLNPEPDVNPGILVQHNPEAAEELIRRTDEGTVQYEERAMVRARMEDGRELYALNEVFIGHRSHQSARYRISHQGFEEEQSSSGVIVSTGTGATGWARSIYESRHARVQMPHPTDARLVFFVREAWPSPATGNTLVEGEIEQYPLELTSELNDGGVVFGDGIEQDQLPFQFGIITSVGLAEKRLRLVQ